jgi:hypothetical protein
MTAVADLASPAIEAAGDAIVTVDAPGCRPIPAYIAIRCQN